MHEEHLSFAATNKRYISNSHSASSSYKHEYVICIHNLILKIFSYAYYMRVCSAKKKKRRKNEKTEIGLVSIAYEIVYNGVRVLFCVYI